MNSNAATPDIKSNSGLTETESISESISNVADVEVNSSHTSSDNSDLTDLSSDGLELSAQKVAHSCQFQLKTEAGRLLLILPTESQVPATEFSWSEICQQLKQRLHAGERWREPQTIMHLVCADRLLDSRQLQELAEILNTHQIQLKSVTAWRRQTAIAAVTNGYSVEQQQPENSLNSAHHIIPNPLADTLYLEMTVRSGGDIRHPGTVVIFGDVNPGGMVVANGDILVWGRLRGIAHAGALGNQQCVIMALQMEPTQLRIADAIARAPEKSLLQFFPEVAHMTPQGIRIVRANGFSRSQLSKIYP